jgi:hypothetical protein
MTQPWHRQKGEPARWYYRFIQYYVPQGPERTFEKAHDLWAEDTNHSVEGRPSASWTSIPRRWDWIERAAAWDQAVAERALEKTEKEREDMLAKHIRSGLALQQVALNKLRMILEGDPENGIAPQWDQLSAMQMLSLLDKGIAIERQARGMPQSSLDLTSDGKPISPVTFIEVVTDDDEYSEPGTDGEPDDSAS